MYIVNQSWILTAHPLGLFFSKKVFVFRTGALLGWNCKSPQWNDDCRTMCCNRSTVRIWISAVVTSQIETSLVGRFVGLGDEKRAWGSSNHGALKWLLIAKIASCTLSIKVGFSRPTHSDSFSPKRCLCSEQVHCLDETVNLLNEMMTAVPCAAIVQLSGYGFQQLSPVKLKHPVPKENKELLWGEAPIIEQSGASAWAWVVLLLLGPKFHHQFGSC